MATRYSFYGNIVTDGLMFNFDLAKKECYPGTGTVLTDIGEVPVAGSIITGSLVNGARVTSDRKQKAAFFDGIDDYFNTTTLQSFTMDNFSIWFKPTITYNSATSGGSLVQLRYDASLSTSWYIALGSATGLLANEYITLTDASANSRTGVADGGSLTANTWYNLTINWNPTNLRYNVYVNNSIKTTIKSTVDATRLTNPNRLYLATVDGEGSGPRFFYSGSVGQVMAYNRALTTTEMTRNYDSLRGRYGL